MIRRLILDLVARFVRDGSDGLSFATVPVMPSPAEPNRIVMSAPGTDIFAEPSGGTYGQPEPAPPLGRAC